MTDVPEEYADAVDHAVRLGKRHFSDGEFTVFTNLWCDGDYEVQVRSGTATSDAENTVQEQFTITPHETRYELIETTQAEEFIELVSREYGDGVIQ